MDGLMAFLDMGGYAAYVWPSYLAAAILLIGLAGASYRSWRTSAAILGTLQAERRHARRGEGRLGEGRLGEGRLGEGPGGGDA